MICAYALLLIGFTGCVWGLRIRLLDNNYMSQMCGIRRVRNFYA